MKKILVILNVVVLVLLIASIAFIVNKQSKLHRDVASVEYQLQEIHDKEDEPTSEPSYQQQLYELGIELNTVKNKANESEEKLSNICASDGICG